MTALVWKLHEAVFLSTGVLMLDERLLSAIIHLAGYSEAFKVIWLAILHDHELDVGTELFDVHDVLISLN